LFRRLAVLATAVLSVVVVADAPALAAANPYTPQEACAEDYGGSWSVVSDGSRPVRIDSGAQWGTVYLLYNSANGWNCTATMKSQFVGTRSLVGATLWIEGDSYQSRGRGGYFQYFETFAYPARGKCVAFSGTILAPNGSNEATGGRAEMKNCG
jgi:hypothetical protein